MLENHITAIDHVDLWNRMLAGFGDMTKHTTPMTIQANTYRFNSDIWQQMATALAFVQSTLTDKEAVLVTAVTE